MPVVGTAGHVDHGKTALIAALTGMDTDRLPEEKARGMTTDIGFAHFAVDGLGEVGVIDVPGHERFIRNMVAGAGGMDGALFVVAADDGWMPQSGRHLEVLAALGVPILAIAVTKTGLAGEARSRAVGEEARSRIADACGQAPPALPVDSLSGTGVPGLRAALGAALLRLPRSPEGPGPYLFVDRVFTLRGSGLVVAGTLRGARLGLGSELALLPGDERLRVRGLQRFGSAAELAYPGDRIALSLARARVPPERGDCLAGAGAEIEAATSFYLSLGEGRRGLRPRPGTEMELASGSAHRMARVWPAKTPGFVRVEAERPFAFARGKPLVLLRSGGADLVAAGTPVFAGGSGREERRALEEALSRYAASGSRGAFALALEGWTRIATKEALPEGAAESEGFAFSPGRWERLRSAAREASREPGGFPEAGIAGRFGLPAEAAKAALLGLEAEGVIVRREGLVLPAAAPPREAPRGAEAAASRGPGPAGPPRARLARTARPAAAGPASARSGDSDPAASLPPPSRTLLRRIEAAGEAGFDLDAAALPGGRRDVAPLCRLGLVAGLDSRLFLSSRAKQALVGRILEGREPGSRFTVAEAKEATGLSRKWILPLLNKMEDEGLVRREGDARLVLGARGR